MAEERSLLSKGLHGSARCVQEAILSTCCSKLSDLELAVEGLE